MPRFRRRFCEAMNCNNTSENRVMFHMPSDPVKLEKWGKSIELKPTNKKGNFLCSDHFEMWCFTDTFKRRLIKEACPSIQVLPHETSSEKQSYTDISTESLSHESLENVDDAPVASAIKIKKLCSENEKNAIESINDIEISEIDLFDDTC